MSVLPFLDYAKKGGHDTATNSIGSTFYIVRFKVEDSSEDL